MVKTTYKIKTNLKTPLRFAFVSDLHDTPNEPILSMIDAQGVDAVLVGGDFIHSNSVYRRGIEFLKSSSSAYPTFIALGNHEMRLGSQLRSLCENVGGVVLDNAMTEFCGIFIGGLTTGFAFDHHGGSRLRTPPPCEDFLDAFEKVNGFKLLISHHPEYYEKYIRPRNIDLTVSGHAHGGQWRFFGCGVFAPGQGIFPKYTSGMYDGRLIVGRGLGNPHIIPRINNREELVIIELE